MEIEMEGVPREEERVVRVRSVGYWIARGVIEVVLAFGVFLAMSFIILGFDFDARHFVKFDGIQEEQAFKLLVLYGVITIALPWLIYGCFQTERKKRFLFLFRWGAPMSMVIWLAANVTSHT